MAKRARALSQSKGNLKPNKAQSSGQRVYDALKQSILAVEILPDADLEEPDLVHRFGVSRTPVREALVRLAAEGLVRLYPNRSARVADLTFTDLLDHQETMEIILPAVCYLAALRRNEKELALIKSLLDKWHAAVNANSVQNMVAINFDFHRVIGQACHNKSLQRGYLAILPEKLRITHFAHSSIHKGAGATFSSSFAEAGPIYDKLVEAISDQDPMRAEAAGREHNAHIRKQFARFVAAGPAAGFKLQLHPLQG